MLKILLCCLILIIFLHSSNSNLPTILPVCVRDDPQLANCIIRTVYAIKPRFLTGDLGDGIRITRLDPLHIPMIVYGREHTLQTRMTDIYLKGLSNFRVEKLLVNIRDIMFDMTLAVPRIDMKANYKMILGYLGTPMYSEGKLFETITNIKIRAIIKGRLYNIKGQKYLNFDPIYFKIEDLKIKFINFTNLFPSTVVIGPFVKQQITDNIDYFHERINPDIEKSFSEIFTKVANQIALSAPFDEVFPI